MSRNKLTELLTEVGNDYKTNGKANYEIHQGHDVHAFYRLVDNDQKIVHVQGYPGLSSNEQARVYARLMDHSKIIEIRKSEEVSVGNEHEAVTMTFPNFDLGVFIPYNSQVLEKMIEENIPELK